MSFLAGTKKNRIAPVLAVLCAFLGAACHVLAQGLTFNSINIPDGSGSDAGPLMVLPVDINNTGHPGLVCANFGFIYLDTGFGAGGSYGSTLTVFTNDGQGNLTSNATLEVGLDPVGLATADVNGDGFVDIICANVGSNSLTVLTNNRHGGFRPRWHLSPSARESVYRCRRGCQRGRVRGFDLRELWQPIRRSRYFDQQRLTAPSKLSATLSVGAGTSPTCIAAGDINGDGSVDLVCALGTAATDRWQYSRTTARASSKKAIRLRALPDVAPGAIWVLGADVDGNGSASISITRSGGDGFTNFIVHSNQRWEPGISASNPRPIHLPPSRTPQPTLQCRIVRGGGHERRRQDRSGLPNQRQRLFQGSMPSS
jgi:hypothetical protein